jgi:DNA-binding GntR family transcriptional regulator
LIQQITNELKVSRTPVKEALVRLVADGYIEMYEGRYFRIKEISVENIMNILETRQVLECHVVENLAEIITASQIQTLDDILKKNDQAVEAHNSAELMQCDELFHSTLMKFYNNKVISDLLTQLREGIRVLRFMTQSSQHIYLIGEEHRKVVNALKKHDKDTAKRMMQEHLERVKASMKSVLEQRTHPLIANTVLYNNIPLNNSLENNNETYNTRIKPHRDTDV